MNANPLTGSSDKAESAARTSDKRIVKLVSNAPAADVHGLEDFLGVFNTGEVAAEIAPFKYIIQRRVKRALGGKFGKGLSTEVTENIEINLNEDLFGLRRWLAAIRQDPGSVMLLNIFKIKEDSLAAPLVFSEMLKTGRPILVTSADHAIHAQLLAVADPNFEKIPKEVENNPALKSAMLARIQRAKGFVQSMRNLMELDYLPTAAQDRISQIVKGGDPSTMSEAEIINLCLLSDAVSRYRPVLDHFKTSMVNSSLQVPQLISMFEILTADVPFNQLLVAFEAFIIPDQEGAPKPTNKGHLFGHVMRFVSGDDGAEKMGRMDRMSKFHKTLANNFIKHRMRIDPFLWKHCHFLGKADPAEKKLIEGVKPLFRVMQQVVRSGEEMLGDEPKKQVAVQIFQLIQMGNRNPAQLKTESDFAQHNTANRLLSLIHQENANAFNMSRYLGQDGQVVSNPDEFLAAFNQGQLPMEDIRRALLQLRPVLFLNEVVAAEIQRSTLDVMKEAGREREKTLREIYILNALSELENFSFHIGDKKLSNFDRVCGISLGQSRLGLEISANPAQEASIGLFVSDQEAPIGKLQNDPILLRLAYTELVGLRVERLVRKAVDHKINYLQQTYGSNFFEVIYNGVVIGNNLPLSRNQFAAFIRERRLLGNLDAKGWKPINENVLSDPYLLFAENPAELRKKKMADAGPLKNFEQIFAQTSTAFRQHLNEVKTAAEESPDDDNPAAIMWSLFRQGIYNMSRPEAKATFRKSIFFRNLQELIAKISSENYSTFTGGIVEGGIKIFIPWQFSYLQLIGNRFSFIVGDQVIKYQLLSSPTDKPEELDDVSRLLYQKLGELLTGEGTSQAARNVCELGELINRTDTIWREYSRAVSLAVMDRVLGETLIKQLEPGRIQARHLWYLPDPRKLCLGRAAISTETVPFGKILQTPENMGNILKNPRSSSTTIDDFSILVHRLGRLKEELQNYASIAEDSLDILQNMSHERLESPAVAKYEQSLQHLVRTLGKPLRHYSEKDVQVLHTLAKQIKEILSGFMNSPSSQKQKLTTRLQAHLQARRSDGHNIRLNYSDEFLLDKTEIKITRKVQHGDEVVSRQKKVEVEMEATHQTLPLRIREVIKTQEILQRIRHIIFSPEGHKKKQVEYSMDIIEILLTLRGNAVTFYADTSGLSTEQVDVLAKRIKPHNFFNMDDIKPELAEGMKATVTMDAITGRAVVKQGGAAETPAEAAPPAPPPAEEAPPRN